MNLMTISKTWNNSWGYLICEPASKSIRSDFLSPSLEEALLLIMFGYKEMRKNAFWSHWLERGGRESMKCYVADRKSVCIASETSDATDDCLMDTWSVFGFAMIIRVNLLAIHVSVLIRTIC
jgi:hypothetical protein